MAATLLCPKHVLRQNGGVGAAAVPQGPIHQGHQLRRLVVGDGFQRDVRHAVIDEALADAAVGGGGFGRGAGDLAFLRLPLFAVGQQVIGIARAHQAGSG